MNCLKDFQLSRMKKGNSIKLMLETELLYEKFIWSSDDDYFQNYLEFLYLFVGKTDENGLGEEDSN